MKAVIQRVQSASVVIDGKIHNEIGIGFLALVGIAKGDSIETVELMCRKIIDLRVFEDSEGKMNLSLKDINGEILVISQFTLCTDNNKSGNRPSFISAEEPERAEELYNHSLNYFGEYYRQEKVMGGIFAADMKVSLINDGPVTIILER